MRPVLRGLLWLPVMVALGWLLGFGWFLSQIWSPPSPPPPADGIVVFTGGADRVAAGLGLLYAGHAARLLVSGVGHQAALRDLANASGLDPAVLAPFAAQVTLGRAAGSTHGNALETEAWARQFHLGALIVVTAGYHMPRALAELRGRLPDVVLIPYAVQPPGMRAVPASGTWRFLAIEYSKFLAVELGLEAVAIQGKIGVERGE